MVLPTRHLRSLMIALVALALSAGLALGAQAPQAAAGLAKAASHTSQNVGSGDEVTTTEDTETDETETDEDTGDGGDNCTTDPTDSETDLSTLTHGQIVCWAAHQETPDGYRNHGAWVSEWAKGNHGSDASTKSNGKAKGLANRP